MQDQNIALNLQPTIIASFLEMLRHLEVQAVVENDAVLFSRVEAWYQQWNQMTGDDKAPSWIKKARTPRYQAAQGKALLYDGQDKNLE